MTGAGGGGTAAGSRACDGEGVDPARLAAAAMENRFRLAWRRGAGGRCHADLKLRPARGPAAPACAAAPRVTGLPLQHSPAPCALAPLQGAPAGREIEGESEERSR